MAYTKNQLEKLALAAIEEHELTFLIEVISYLPVSKGTFYQYKMNQMDSLKGAIEKVKVETKSFLRKEWKTSQAAAERIALYKLLSSKEEHDLLNNNVQQTVVVERSKYEVELGN